jgi:hypothetical protein
MSEDKELEDHMSKLMNPRVRNIEVGIRTLRTVKMYPLSLPDQLDLNDMVVEGIQAYVSEAGETLTPKTIQTFVNLFRKNIMRILGLLFPDEDAVKLQHDIDNQQLADIVEVAYTVNYGDPAKKLVSLFRGEKKEQESPMERLSRLSAETIQATDLTTSPSDITEKVESHKVN